MSDGGLLSDHLIHPGEVAKALALSVRTLDKLDKTGVLPKVRIPGLGVIPEGPSVAMPGAAGS